MELKNLDLLSRVLLRLSLALCAPVAVFLGARAIVQAEVPSPPVGGKKLSAAELKANFDYLKPEVYFTKAPLGKNAALDGEMVLPAEAPFISLSVTPQHSGMFKIHAVAVVHCENPLADVIPLKLGVVASSGPIAGEYRVIETATAVPALDGVPMASNVTMRPMLLAQLQKGEPVTFKLLYLAAGCKNAYLTGPDGVGSSGVMLFAERIGDGSLAGLPVPRSCMDSRVIPAALCDARAMRGLVLSVVLVAGCARGVPARGLSHEDGPLASLMAAPEQGQVLAAVGGGQVVAVAAGKAGPIELRPGCLVAGGYTYSALPAPGRSVLPLDPAFVQARMPRIAAELSGASALRVRMEVVGGYQLTSPPPPSAWRGLDCGEPSHLVAAVSVGAVSLEGLDPEGRSLDLGDRTLQLSEAQREEIAAWGGAPRGCALVDGRAPEGCERVVRLSLAEIEPRAPSRSVAGPLIFAGLGGALLLASGGFFLGASSEFERLRASCGQRCSASDRAAFERGRTLTYSTLTGGLLSLSVAGVWWGATW